MYFVFVFFFYFFSCSLHFLVFFFLSICSFYCSLLQAGESNGLFKKTITKLSTEYRLQFVWPNVRKSKVGQKSNVAADAVDQPKKSLSMGAIIKAQQAQQQQTMMPTVHKKRTTNQKEGATINCRLIKI